MIINVCTGGWCWLRTMRPKEYFQELAKHQQEQGKKPL
jgi:hypothetical protein